MLTGDRRQEFERRKESVAFEKGAGGAAKDQVEGGVTGGTRSATGSESTGQPTAR